MSSSRPTAALLFLVLALVASSCRAETTIDNAAIAPIESATVDDATADDASPSNDAAATPAATPESVAPTPTPEPVVPEREVYTGTAPPLFAAPASWDDAFALDPTVTQGVLANGITYLIKSNDRPGDQAQLRLVIRAGSLNEEPGTEGVAHFLEHMMFNGTERFPGNEIVQVLEGFGSSFGADVNASTTFHETIYELQVPARSADTLQLGLDVLYQWATAATIDPGDVADERGVVREEHRRAVEPLSGRLGVQIREILFDGTDYLGSEPIGSAEVIDTMTAAELRAFYERWYRPELMTVIAVGDFNVADIEQRIGATFVQPPSDPATEPLDFLDATGSLTEPVFDVLTDSEIQRPEIQVLWRLAAPVLTTKSGLREGVVQQITMAMLNNRLFERVQGGQSVFLSANAGLGGLTAATQLTSISATASAEELGGALEELLVEIEQARQFGFTNEELQRELDGLRVVIAQLYSESATRQDAAVTGDLVQTALGRDVLVAPDDQLAIATEVFDSITVADAQRFLFDVLDNEPYVLLTAPESVEPLVPVPETLAVIYDSVVARVVDEYDLSSETATELLQRPEPAAVVDRQLIEPLDATIVTYENGARLIFRDTRITENIVRLRAESPGGFFAIDGPEVPLLDRTPSLVAGSGFESVDIVSLNRLLSGSLATLSTSIGRSEEQLFGGGSTDDLETIFQLVHLQMTEPMITDLQLRQFDEQWRPFAENPETTPGIAADLELWRLRYGDSPWFRLIPTLDDLDTLDRDLLLAAYQDRFADAGDFTFAVVGDFDAETLIDLGARYLGTLPDSGRRESPIDRDPGVPEENLVATVEAGVGDQGRVRINWESPYPFTLEAAVTAQALELIVNARLRDLIREQLGASYSPNASISVIAEPKSWVDTIIEIESDPERVEEVSQAIRDELARIRSGEFDPQYLELAVDQLVEQYRFFNNDDWLDLLLFHSRYTERPAGEFRDRSQLVVDLTVADIAAAAQVVFPESRSVEIRLLPAAN